MDYPNMWGYVRDLYQTSGIGETVDAEHIQKHYQVNKYLQLENQEFSFWRIQQNVVSCHVQACQEGKHFINFIFFSSFIKRGFICTLADPRPPLTPNMKMLPLHYQCKD